MQKQFWKAAGFSGAIGTLARGAAMLYGSVSGHEIDAEQVAAVVEQVTTILCGGATAIATLLSAWHGLKGAFGKAKEVFAPKPAGMEIRPQEGELPWLKDKQPPQQ